MKVTAAERDADGKVTAKLAKVRSKADIEGCQAADASLRAPSKDPSTATAPTSPIDGGTVAKPACLSPSF